MNPGAPVFAVVDFAAPWIEKNNSFAGEKDRLAHAVEVGNYRRRVAGLVIGGLPDFLPRGLSKGNEAAIPAAEVHEQEIAFRQGRGRHAKKAFGNLILGIERSVPNLVARLQIQAVQPGFGTQGVDVFAGDERRRSGTVA